MVVALPGYLSPVLGIRDILVLIRIRGSVPLTYGSGSSSTLRLHKIFFFFFLEFTRRHIIFSLQSTVIKINFVLKFYFASIIFSLLNTFMRKGKDPDLGGPKHVDLEP
jgi:hypothetical protein